MQWVVVEPGLVEHEANIVTGTKQTSPLPGRSERLQNDGCTQVPRSLLGGQMEPIGLWWQDCCAQPSDGSQLGCWLPGLLRCEQPHCSIQFHVSVASSRVYKCPIGLWRWICRAHGSIEGRLLYTCQPSLVLDQIPKPLATAQELVKM